MRETDYLKENKNVLALLKRIERFKTFSDEELFAFLRIGKLKEYNPGEVIIQKGDKDSWVYFLISGEVKVVKGSKTFAVLNRSGDLFGEMGVIDSSPRSASVWARTKSMVLGIDCSQINDREDLLQVAFHYTIFRLFAETLAERLRLTSSEVAKLTEEVEHLREELAKARGETPAPKPDDGMIWI